MRFKGNHWSWLPRIEDGLRVHHLGNETIGHVISNERFYSSSVHSSAKTPRTWILANARFKKLGWTLGQANSVHQQKPCLGMFASRQADFVRPRDPNELEIGQFFKDVFLSDCLH